MDLKTKFLFDKFSQVLAANSGLVGPSLPNERHHFTTEFVGSPGSTLLRQQSRQSAVVKRYSRLVERGTGETEEVCTVAHGRGSDPACRSGGGTALDLGRADLW